MATKNNGQRVASGKEQKSLDKIRQEAVEKEATAKRFDELPDEVAGALPELAVEYLAINMDMAALDRRKETLKEQIKAVIEVTGEQLIVGDFFVTEMVVSTRPRKIDSRLLLQHGVALDVIEACTVGGDQYRYLQVRAREDS